MTIFEGDPSGSPGKIGMTVIEIITFELDIPWGSRNFLASTQQLYRDTPTMTRIWYAQKSRGIFRTSSATQLNAKP